MVRDRGRLRRLGRNVQVCHCTLRLAADEREDCGPHTVLHSDGRGLVDDVYAGLGLASMRKRAAALSVTCTLEARPGAGSH